MSIENKAKKQLNYTEICELLPHRPPLILVDRVLDIDYEALSIHAIKCVSPLDPYFAGHFPNMPMFPGVYIIEGLAQSSAVMCFQNFVRLGVAWERKCMLTTVEEAKFRKPVVPGDVIHYHTKFERSRGTFVWFSGVAKIDGEVVAEAKFSALLATPITRRG